MTNSAKPFTLIEAFEQRGEIPVAENISSEEFYGSDTKVLLHRCPWCNHFFMVEMVNYAHCPYCCEPVELDWGE